MKVASTAAENTYATITDVLLHLNLSISKVRGHCYDGASAMSGCKSGVVTRLCAAEPRAVFTHYYGHALNLACGDTIKQSKLMRDALDTTYEITKLIKKSPGLLTSLACRWVCCSCNTLTTLVGLCREQTCLDLILEGHCSGLHKCSTIPDSSESKQKIKFCNQRKSLMQA